MVHNLHLRLVRLYQTLKASFWLIPLCMLAIALVLAPVVVKLDIYLAASSGKAQWPELLLSVEGSRMILSSIAGSMITVASLVFSMTLVALSLVAQQLGPRILQIFMEDRPTQIMLGLFIATFLFAMIVLVSVGAGRGETFIPVIGVFTACGLAVIAFVAVILFVHHIAKQIQADVVIFNIACKLDVATESLLEGSSSKNEERVDRKAFEDLQSVFDQNGLKVSGDRASGYIQHIDIESAISLAQKHDLRVDLVCRPGDFVLEGRPIMQVAPEASADKDMISELVATVQIGPQRTRAQHVEFEMLALVEIAIRALSKGINDPFTAISCVDWLSVTLAKLVKHFPDYRIYRDEKDCVRVLGCPQTFEYFLVKTLAPIRDAANDVPMVLERLEMALSNLKAVAVHETQRIALDDQLAMLDKLISKKKIAK